MSQAVTDELQGVNGRDTPRSLPVGRAGENGASPRDGGAVSRRSRCGYPYFPGRVRTQESEAVGATTVVVVDDHSGFRACARLLLEEEGYRVVGGAADGASAVTCARDLRPQVALVDVYLPDVD